ncbi:MAG: hypothetical protein BEH78_00085 [Pseudomonas sp. BDAL1]|nr:MAG: hypothetical protein BEH78_00085 [Pseudomonas sp. BDAL1]
MKLHLENKLSLFQRKSIAITFIYFLIANILIFLRLPKKEPICLDQLTKGLTGAEIIQTTCIQKLINSIILVEQINFYIHALFITCFGFLLAAGGTFLFRWIYKA